MEPLDDEASLKALNDIDSARLALRGALATIRDMQDANVRLKGNLQEATAKEKLSASQNAELRKQLEELRAQVKHWDEERAEEAARQRRFEDACRLKIRAEERAGAEQERRAMGENLVRLSGTVELLRQSKEEAERRQSELKRLLDQRDGELLASQREKVDLVTHVHQDQESLGRMRIKRDEEIQALLRAKDAELENHERELREAVKKNEELQRALAAAAQQSELKLQDREEALTRQFREKERDLQERYAKREAELQASWSELENGLWARTKEAREKLDRSVQAQFDERARALADRSREVEDLLESRRLALEEEHRQRLSEGERALAEKEKALVERAQRLEGELLKRAEAEIAKEKELVQAGGLEQARALEEEYREKLAAASRRHADVEQSLARRRQELEAEGSGQSARLQLAHAVKEKALEEAAQTKLVELQEEFLRKEAQLSDEWTRRKVDLLSEQQRAIEAEIQAKKIELEQRSNALEEGYRARVAELERAHVALDEQFRMWKATAQADTARREKSLEQRYFLREQELSRGHEMTLEAERRTARLQAQEAKEQFEAMRESLLKESFAREEAAKSAYEKLERQLKDDHDQRERELDAKYRAELDEAVVRHRDLMAQQARHFENEASRREEEFRRELAAHQESRQSERLELEHRLANAEAELGAARERVAKSEGEHHGLFEDLLARERTLEAERADAERQVKQRDQERERKYLALESELQALWTKKEREYLEAHREALTRAQAQFAEALAAEEQTRRAEREAHERALAAQEERQQSRVVQWQEQTLADVAHEKEEWLERQRRAIEHEREILRRQTSEGFELEKAATLEEQRAGLQAEWSKRGSELEKQWKAREEALAAKAEERERELKREFERRHEDLQAQSREGLQEMAKALEREREQAKAELARQAREAEQTLVGAERAFKERTARVEGEAADREAALRDASARREAELQEAALRLRDELKAASAAPAVMDPAARHEKEFNDLVFGIAHQVRNPLGIIQSLAEERRGDFWASRRQKEAAEVTLRAVRSLEARLEQLIEYARPLALKHAPVEPGRLFEKAAAQTGEACRRQGIDVSRPAQAGLAPVMADAERLRDALARLAENAVDAMPHGGTLTLAARAAAGCLELEIADTGRGIEPKQLREVGRPFFTTKPGGLGLGLAIARRVVEAHGGTLEIESERGKGTRVVCRLPLKA